MNVQMKTHQVQCLETFLWEHHLSHVTLLSSHNTSRLNYILSQAMKHAALLKRAS